jgi:uncharacterized repeat protein (TIGR04138 family)
MPQQTKEVDWKRATSKAGPYPIEAFNFVRDGLNYTVDRVHQEPCPVPPDSRHISGRQLSMGLRDYAIERFGMLAPEVLSYWHIRRTEDFGRIVFAMIDLGLMSKTEDDTLEDFRGVYDFEEAFSDAELAAWVTAARGNN